MSITTATIVGGEGMLDLAVALSKRPTFSETPFAEGCFGNSEVNLLWGMDWPLREFGWISTKRTSNIRLFPSCWMASKL